MELPLQKIFRDISKLKVAVVGDVILDSYLWGNVERISPEAPVPVVHLHKQEYRAGGAANVAANMQSLGAKVFLLSIIGNDNDGATLKKLLQKNKLNTQYIVSTPQRITTNKTRVISRHQQIVRIDSEQTDKISKDVENKFLTQIKNLLSKEKIDLLVFEDYNKGVLNKTIIENCISLCKKKNILTAVDPKKENFFSYKGVDIFKPNLKEVFEALHIEPTEINISLLKNIHQQLSKKLSHHISLITLSEKGVFYQTKNKLAIIPSHLRKIADVSGAGDTVIATASLIYSVTKNIEIAAEVANIAGGIVCEIVGTEKINKDDLIGECTKLIKQDFFNF